MKKHAYLIMAHSEWELLNKLLFVLDDVRNDIYIHIDKKVNVDFSSIYSPLKSNCFFIRRMGVSWGGDSQIKCEIALLREANKIGYEYYHLISGVDLPIKCQDYIHDFFKRNKGKNYIKIDKKAMMNGYPIERIKEYHLFQNFIGRNRGHIVGLLYRIEKRSILVQKKLKVDRLKSCPYKIYKGTNWFSITDEMARLVISQYHFIKKYCCHGFCADEIFLQTVAMNSMLKSTIEDEDLRCIDWERGNPYTYTTDDLSMLMKSEKLFARKFSSAVDNNIIDRIVESVLERG